MRELWRSSLRRVSGVLVLVLLTVVLAIAAGANGLPPGGTFADDDGNPHEGNIEAIAAAGVTQGCDVGLYCPGDRITRGQMASFLARAFAFPTASKDYFPDDNGSTHEANINRIAEAGVTLGYADGTYRPDGFVTRGQMGSFIARAMGLSPMPGDRFNDVSGPHEGNINAIAEAGVTLGCNPEGTLYCPNDLVRRDRMASFIARALDLAPIMPPPPTTTTTTTTLPPTTFGSGTWIVGSEVPADTYRNTNSSGGCYWARLNGFGGTLDDIIANEFTYVRMIVTIDPTDKGFESSDCGTWSNDLSPITSSPTASFGGGTFQVDTEVAGGTWRNSNSAEGCYWERLSGFSGTLDDVITNEFTYDISTVTISLSDVGFFSEDCGTWTRIGG